MRTYDAADITLVENSTACNPDRQFLAQKINIKGAPTTYSQSVDGFVSYANHPTEIIWFGGTVAQLEYVTNVKIVHKGAVLVDGEINTFYGGPRAVPEGVHFYVMAGN
jgi:hypothetical protein